MVYDSKLQCLQSYKNSPRMLQIYVIWYICLLYFIYIDMFFNPICLKGCIFKYF